jgi:hypothetical protein
MKHSPSPTALIAAFCVSVMPVTTVFGVHLDNRSVGMYACTHACLPGLACLQ